jgi:hypothetical protein
MATKRSTQTFAQKYSSLRKTGGASTSQSSYASTLAKRQSAAEDDYYDTAYTNGQITSEQYINNLNQRLTRTYLTPLQKQNINQKVDSVNTDYQDQLVQTAYQTGSTYNGQVVDSKFMLDREQKKLDGMTQGSEAYSKQQAVVSGLTDKVSKEARSTYRQDQLTALSTMRETSSTELQAKADMYTKLEAMARADGATQEADNYAIQKNNYVQGVDRAATSERIQKVNLANSQPVAPMPANPTTGQISSTEQQFANGQVPTSNNQSVVDYYVGQAKNAGITDPNKILQYINNQGLTITVTLPEIKQSMTSTEVPKITPFIVQYAGISLDQKVYDRIKASKEIQDYLSKNAKLINEVQGETGKNNGLVGQIDSQLKLVNALKSELDKASADNRDSILLSYNNATEKYNGLIQRKDDLMTKLQDQATGFQEVVTKKADAVMKEQDTQFESELQNQIKKTQEDFSKGKLSKEEYVATLNGIAGTPFEQGYKDNLVKALQQKGVKVPTGTAFSDIAKLAISKGVKSEADIQKEVYGLYGVGNQMYQLRSDLYNNVGDANTKSKIDTMAADYSIKRKWIGENVVPNLQNLRVVQADEGNDKTINLTTMGYGVKKGDFYLADPVSGAAQQGITPQDAVKSWENNHTQVGGVWYPVRTDTSKSTLQTPEAKKAEAGFSNAFYYKQIDANGKETVVPIKGVDYGAGATKYIPTNQLDKLLKTNYVTQQGDKLVRNFNAGQDTGQNPIYTAALKVAASPIGSVLKNVLKGIPGGIGTAVSLLDAQNQPNTPAKKQTANPIQGFLNTAKTAISSIARPVAAATTTAKPISTQRSTVAPTPTAGVATAYQTPAPVAQPFVPQISTNQGVKTYSPAPSSQISSPAPQSSPQPVMQSKAPAPVYQSKAPAPIYQTPAPKPVYQTPAPISTPAPKPAPAPKPDIFQQAVSGVKNWFSGFFK